MAIYRKYTVVVLLILLFFSLTACDIADDFNDFIDVQGYIYTLNDQNEKIPLSNVEINTNGETATTDSTGFYYLKNVYVHKYLEWNAYKDGYLTEEPQQIRIFPGQTTISINETLLKTSNYTGKVSGNIVIMNTANQNSTQSRKIGKEHTDQQALKINKQTTFSPNYKKGEILVRFKPGMRTQSVNHKGQVVQQINSNAVSKDPIYMVRSEDMTTKELYTYYKNLASVETVSYNHIGYLMNTPNDPLYNDGYQWHFDNIHMPKAWDIATGSNFVKVAIVDTGYLPHDDLDNNIGYDGYDFIDNDYEPYDDHAYYNSDNDYIASHGTHVAGIVGAVTNNYTGIAGTSWNVELMPLRIFKLDQDNNQYFTELDLIKAINYAVDHGADVINLSLAFVSTYLDENDCPFTEEALARAYNNDVTVVAAAGNSNIEYVFYPARSFYTIAVGATDYENKLASYSNYGERLDILAPGGDSYSGILSTHKFGQSDYDEYLYMAGTSMATPIISGIAALLNSKGIRDPEEIRQILGRTSEQIFDSRLEGVGLVNADLALKSATKESINNNLKVMAVIKDGSTYYVASDEADVDYYGDYYIPHVRTEKNLSIIGWQDSNNNDLVDGGDYFGEYDIGYVEPGEHIRNVEFSVEYLSSDPYFPIYVKERPLN